MNIHAGMSVYYTAKGKVEPCVIMGHPEKQKTNPRFHLCSANRGSFRPIELPLDEEHQWGKHISLTLEEANAKVARMIELELANYQREWGENTIQVLFDSWAHLIRMGYGDTDLSRAILEWVRNQIQQQTGITLFIREPFPAAG